MTGARPTLDDVAGAELSDCGHHRYLLWRVWDTTRPPLGWIMLNPSAADARQDDPTIRRCVAFAKRDDYGGIRVANLYSLRATHPYKLSMAGDPVGGPDGDPWGWLIPWGPGRASGHDVALAWGSLTNRRWGPRRARSVIDKAPPDVRLLCLGTTKSGQPRHPLYLASDTPFVAYSEVPA